MKAANRIIFNTGVLYVKIVVTTLISLVSVPLVLNAMGESDYGTYTLVGGVIALLAFLKSSMVVSTQRFLSVTLGEGKIEKLNSVYNTSLVLHLMIGAMLILVLESCAPWLFGGVLNISEGRISAARTIYHFMVFTTFFDVASVPFMGVINAKEDMFVFSLIGIAEALLKLAVAFYIGYWEADKLVFYGASVFLISLFSVTCNLSYVRYKYKEFALNLVRYFDRNTFRNLLGFTLWNTFGAVAILGRNQGVAVIMNLFYGTVVNAAYGIANQINGVLGYFSVTFQKSINPQLMKSQGMEDGERLCHLSHVSSKYSTLAMAMLAVPLIMEMEYVLNFWLGHVPEYTLQFSRLVIIMSILNQFSSGLMSAISASGRIRNYQMVISVFIMLNVPLSYVLLKYGLPPYYCVIGFIGIELLSFGVRLYMAHGLVGIHPVEFFSDVVKPTLVCILLPAAAVYPLMLLMEASLLRLVLLTGVYLLAFATMVWTMALHENERKVFVDIKNNVLKRIGL